VYSDRFIPSRAGSDVAARLLELGDDAQCATHHNADREARTRGDRCGAARARSRAHPAQLVLGCRMRVSDARCGAQDTSQTYAAMLRNSLQLDSPLAPPLTSPTRPGSADREANLARSASLGCAAAARRDASRPGTQRASLSAPAGCRGGRPGGALARDAAHAPRARRGRSSPGVKKLFRFHSDGANAGAAAESPFALSPMGADFDLVAARKPARKIARSPFKARARAGAAPGVRWGALTPAPWATHAAPRHRRFWTRRTWQTTFI
jgi:hypothetical protein